MKGDDAVGSTHDVGAEIRDHAVRYRKRGYAPWCFRVMTRPLASCLLSFGGARDGRTLGKCEAQGSIDHGQFPEKGFRCGPSIWRWGRGNTGATLARDQREDSWEACQSLNTLDRAHVPNSAV